MKFIRIVIVLLFIIKNLNAQTPNIPTDIDTPVTPIYMATYPSAYPSGTLVNWSRTTSLLKPVSDTSAISSLSLPDAMVMTNYADGLGRPIQSVSKKITPMGFDVVQSVYYDSFGRNPVSPLPYKSLTFNYGQFKKASFSDQRNFFDGMFPNDSTNPYSRTLFDDTSLYRSVTQMLPGATKVGSNIGKTTRVMLNDSIENVRMWNYTAGSLPTTASPWPKFSLFVKETIDESGKRTREYKNKEGQLILKKIEVSSTTAGSQHGGWLCTYYVYDDLYQLRYVITPKVVDSIQNSSWVLTQAVSDALCYFYDYDNRGRVIQKKLPGQLSQYVIYDSLNRQVLVQDGNLSTSKQWIFTKYDALGRAIITGKFLNTGGLTVDTLRNQMASNGASSNAFVNFLRNSISINTYTTSSTISDADIYALNYFDDYTNTPSGFSYNDAAVQSLPGGLNKVKEGQSLETATLPTGGYVRIMNGNATTTQWVSTVVYYDTMGRKLQMQRVNAKSGNDTMSFQYDFSGKPLAALIAQKNPGALGLTKVPLVKILKVYTYDNAGRPLAINQKINNEPYYRQIHQFRYDETGKVSNKFLGGTAESQDFSYRIWGDLESINKNYCLYGINDNFFGEVIKYDRGFAKLNKTGLASGLQWRLSGSPTIERAYGYTYDAAGRLTTGDYSQTDGSGWSNGAEDYTAKNISYDGNGNLLRMDQWGTKAGYSGPFQMDQLKYKYNNGGMSNQLNAVDDSISTYYGLGEFQELNGGSPRDYKYDNNGNATSDTNKNIISISYNFLNKPYLIKFTGGRSITFTYDAAGNLLSKQIVESGQPNKTIDYLGNLEYVDSALSIIGHEEGRTRPVALIDATSDTMMYYEYDFFVKDHMGNVRSVVTEEVDSDWYTPTTLPSGALSFGIAGYDPRTPYPHFEGYTLGPKTYTVTNETSNAAVEEMLFDNVAATRDNKVGSIDQSDLKETRLNGSQTTRRIGPAKMIRVMAGDSIQLSVSTYFSSVGQNNSVALNDAQLVSNLLGSLASGGSGALAGDFTATQLNSSYIQADVTGALSIVESQTQINYSAPQAFLTYILLDDNMQVVPECSGTLQSTVANAWNVLSTTQAKLTRNGYLIVYLSNTSVMDVAFDNLNIVHYKGKLLSENHYYPYGLTVTSNAIVNAPDNNNLYTGKQLNHNEFVSGPGLDWYNYNARQYDPQIGRWHSVDPLMEKSLGVSPYNYCLGNPIALVDPSGMTPAPPHARLPNVMTGFESGAPDGYEYGSGGGNGMGGGGGGGFTNGMGSDYAFGINDGSAFVQTGPETDQYGKTVQQYINYAVDNAVGDITVYENKANGWELSTGGQIREAPTVGSLDLTVFVSFLYHANSDGTPTVDAYGFGGYGAGIIVPALKAAQPQKGPDYLSQINNFLLGTAGLVYGVGEYGLRANAPEIINATTRFLGNDYNVIHAVNGTANILKTAGRGFFVVGSTISLVQGFNKYRNGDYVGTGKSGLDIGVGALSTFGGPVGLLIGTPYYLIDSFEGWDNAWQSAMEMNRNNQQLINMRVINYSDLYKN